MNLVSIGLGNFVPYEKISAIVAPDSAPIKRMVQESKDKGTCVDATYGRRTRAVLLLDNGQVVLAAIQPETIVGRNQKKASKEVDLDD